MIPLCKCGCGKKVAKKGNVWLKGHSSRNKLVSLETRKKQSLQKIGKKQSLTHIKKAADAKRGLVTIRKGKQLTLEHCNNIRIANTGRKHSNSTKEKIRLKNLGRKPVLAKSKFDSFLGHRICGQLEREFGYLLKKQGLSYIYEKEIKLHGGFEGHSYYPDFFVKNVFVECKGWPLNNLVKTLQAKKEGWNLVVLTYPGLYLDVVRWTQNLVPIFVDMGELIEKLMKGVL